ncbi:MAG: SGNH/GDSL hydrolase family protein [Planctomycetaceae bacterium]|nr:SGNH/GDSL hydrolase family protein [Planctomycetaceae bacterium]
MILDSPSFLAGLSLTYLGCVAVWIVAGIAALWGLLSMRHKARRRPVRTRWINAGLSLWFLLAGLTVVELYFAFLYDQSDSFNMTNVSKRWFKRHVQTNADGWRDVHPLSKTGPQGVHRLWFTGDSFTFGHGIKNPADRFSDRVAVALEAQQPGRFAVSNVAEAGINIAQVDNIMRVHLKAGYRFDTLVYVICLNDIEPYVDETGERYKQLGRHAPQFFLFRESYFFNLLWYRFKLAAQPEARNYFSDLADAYHGKPLRQFLNTLDDLQRLCRANDVDLRVAIFPFLHNLGPDYPFAAAHREIAEHCRRKKIRVLDLAPVLEPHLAEGLTVNRFDAHPNERAHQLAADAIIGKLLEDLVEPP